MKQALVTTTIFVPEVLRSYRELDADVQFVIAGDLKTPHEEVEALCDELGNATYIGPDQQEGEHPRLSRAIGFNSVQRRNFAVIEAAKLDPDVIVTIDDDNAPMGDYFAQIEAAFSGPDVYLADGEWFNIGEFAEESYTYRGFPYSQEPRAVLHSQEPQAAHAGQARIGVVNGLIYGDPDINATERIERDPEVTDYGDVAKGGIVLNPSRTWSPINSQNTAYRAGLAPLMLVLPHVGRYDDIWGSYIAQSVLRATGHHVLFGEPFVRQDRNDHDLITDLQHELLGMRHTDQLVACLRAIDVDPARSIVESLGAVVEALREFDWLPHDFLAEWLETWS